MIDVGRWVIVEAWLSLGLRMRWALSYERNDDWIPDDETGQRYYYEGGGVWAVERSHDRRRGPGYPVNDVPQLSTESMRHELAHYLAASPEQRHEKNFGLNDKDNAAEEKAVEAEAVIDAITRACSQVVGSLMAGTERRK